MRIGGDRVGVIVRGRLVGGGMGVIVGRRVGGGGGEREESEGGIEREEA